MYYVGQDLYQKWLCSHIFNIMDSEGGGDPQKINNRVCTVKVAPSISLQPAADLPHEEMLPSIPEASHYSWRNVLIERSPEALK